MAGSIAEHFHELDDPRGGQGKRHGLVEIVTLTILGVICGADEWTEIEDVAWAKIDWLDQFLNLPHGIPYGIPSHDTLGRLFARLDPRRFERCLTDGVTPLAGWAQSDLIAIDGKTLRRSYDPADGKAAPHMVSAWCRANRFVLGQLATDEKSSDITAIPQLLRLLDLEGTVVTIDAMGTQKEIAGQIIDQGGDSLLPVKENQQTLCRDVTLFFDDAIRSGFRHASHASARTRGKGHGRGEFRELWSVQEIDG